MTGFTDDAPEPQPGFLGWAAGSDPGSDWLVPFVLGLLLGLLIRR
jgi:hypothetical protein